ncbi:MAG: hydroxyacylglutathione hydrolase [Gammaproteobacteria bacterium]|nr:MAG: hydroxyacylglutathione hydrolase [Gammaproteobacteria bacterium]
MLNIHAVPSFNDNYIWLIQSPDNQQVIIIDPGDATPVINELTDRQLEPVAILVTHHCHDHVNGIPALVKRYDIPVYGPAKESVPLLTHPLMAIKSLHIGKNIPNIEVLDTPGHTAGHISFVIGDCLFPGDTLFGAGCGRLHNGTAEQLFHSLQQFSTLPAQTKVYCAHEYTETNLRFAITVEPDNVAILQRIKETSRIRQQNLPSLPSTLGLELATNPFLRCNQAEVITSAQQFSGKTLHTAVEVFTTLRLWKDQF